MHLLLWSTTIALAAAGCAHAGKVYFPGELSDTVYDSQAVPVSASSSSYIDESSYEHYPAIDFNHKVVHGDYDNEPGLFAPAIVKPFERARTLTGKYYMPELAYERGPYEKRAPISFSAPVKSGPISVSGLVPVGVPVNLGSYHELHKSA